MAFHRTKGEANTTVIVARPVERFRLREVGPKHRTFDTLFDRSQVCRGSGSGRMGA